MNIPDGTIILEPRYIFDHAIVEYNLDQGVLIYDSDLLVEALIHDSNCTYEIATDYIFYNIIGTKKPGWPIVQGY